MFKSAIIQDIHLGNLTKADGYLAVTTRFFPRFLARAQIDDYIATLAPDKKLLRDFKKASDKLGHNAAFLHVDYQRRFVARVGGAGDTLLGAPGVLLQARGVLSS
jgi:hypothetical protein